MAQPVLDVLVVGAGPTGLSALYHAGEAGLRALAVERGATPAASIVEYLEGLTLISAAHHYEVGGLPLDCRDVNEPTREELLRYYARVVAHGRLQLRCRTRVRRLLPGRDGVTAEVETPLGVERVRARQVLIAALYEPRPLPPELSPRSPRVEVLRALRNPIQVSGKRTVVVGAGLSGYEQMQSIMMCGGQVTLLGRRQIPGYFTTPLMQRLVALTGSRLVPQVRAVRTTSTGVRFIHPDGANERLDCDAVVVCVGQGLDEALLAILLRAKVLAPTDIEALRRAANTDDIIKLGNPPDVAFEIALSRHPDFWSLLFEGRRRIRLVGGSVHPGGATGGVQHSIESARLAIHAAAGRPIPRRLVPPLARALCVETERRLGRPLAKVGGLVPIAVSSWSRYGVPLTREGLGGVQSPRPPVAPGKYLVGPVRNPLLLELLALCDGSRDVRGVLRAAGAQGAAEKEELLKVLDYLWVNNALTWVPGPR